MLGNVQKLDVFKTFSGGLSECNKNCITMHQIDGNSLVQIIQFFYTSEIKINKENVQNLLSAASLLQVSSVLDGCCEFFKRNLSDDNCLGKSLMMNDIFTCFYI